jgi:hypothetical protein
LKKIIAACALAIALAMAGPAAAARVQAETAQAGSDAPTTSPQAWLGELSAWAQLGASLYGREIEIFQEIRAGQARALHYFHEHDLAGGDAWSTDWATQVRRDVTAYRSDVRSILSVPMPAPSKDAVSLPEISRMVRQMAEIMPVLMRHKLADADLMEELIADTIATAKGDAAAANTLTLSNLRTSMASLQGENDTIETARPLYANNAAQLDLTEAAFEYNAALLDLLKFRYAMATHGAVDRGATAASMRAHLAAAGSRLDRLPADRAALAKHLSDIAADPALGPRMKAIFATYDLSVEVERRIGAVIGGVADGVQKGDFDSAPADSALQVLKPLIGERLELDVRRKKMVGGQ